MSLEPFDKFYGQKCLEDFCAVMACKGGKPNIPLLKEEVGNCVRMAVQKSGGQHNSVPKSRMDWGNWERARMTVIAEAIKLVRSGLLDGLEGKTISEKPASFEEYPTWDFYFKKNKWDYQRENSIMEFLKPRKCEANIEALKETVEQLASIPPDCERKREQKRNVILCEAIALVLSGLLEEISDGCGREDDTE